nr:hypothetical protein [Gemmatimonadota bacterium]NIR37543.1 hypothetical protein [Actinomycetota bacterium]NIS32054.1 hypothetical protein [Actinomycetota bacterium]NIU67126.1 hypothetical protein [Actinomycetota bacterium]NIW28905.1 hypothetical protein [Actinomycetota bacterium]
WQGDPDYEQVAAAGYRYAIAKATEGTSYLWEHWWHRNHPRITAAGLTLGAYHFLRTRDPAGQARYFVSTVGDFHGRIAALDVERHPTGDTPGIGHVREFADEFARLVPGHPLVIYTGRWYWRDLIGDPYGAGIGPLWHSEYETSQAEIDDGPEADRYGGWDGCTLWQFTSIGSVPGVGGHCDINMLRRGTLADLTGTTEDDMPTPEQIAKAVWDHWIEEPHTGVGRARSALRDSRQISRRAEVGTLAAVAALGAQIQAIDVDVDEAELARVLAALVPDDLAERVVDELHRRTAD